jgi:ribose 5-phosphate isomerase A
MQERAGASDELRRRAAEAALADVRSGMKLGLGTGRTADHFVRLLGEKVRSGALKVVCVATSERTASLAASCGIAVTTLDVEPALDLAVDGADELDAELRLIKGGGGALLRDKIVAFAARQVIVIVDEAKFVGRLGEFPLPVEVVPFGLSATVRAIEMVLGRLGLAKRVALRQSAGQPFVTDNGNRIVDLGLGSIADPEGLARALETIPGVVEHGLFIGLATTAIIAGAGGIKRLSRERSLL